MRTPWVDGGEGSYNKFTELPSTVIFAKISWVVAEIITPSAIFLGAFDFCDTAFLIFYRRRHRLLVKLACMHTQTPSLTECARNRALLYPLTIKPVVAMSLVAEMMATSDTTTVTTMTTTMMTVPADKGINFVNLNVHAGEASLRGARFDSSRRRDQSTVSWR